MSKPIYIFRGQSKEFGSVHRLKAGVSFSRVQEAYASKFPVILQVFPPSTEELEEMVSRGSCESVDGCEGIEPDGHCVHGYPSWILAYGFI